MCKVFHKLALLTLINKFSMPSNKKYKINFYVMFARTRRKHFSITIKSVSLCNSLHNFVQLSSSLNTLKISIEKVLYLNIDFLQKYRICKLCTV